MHLTDKQLAIMQVIVNKNEDGSCTDLDQILERLSYKTSKASLQFSIRALAAHGLIRKEPEWEKRRGRKRVLIRATGLAADFVHPKPITPSEEGAALDDLITSASPDPVVIEEIIE